jgi:hypothetical protein
MLLGCPLMLAAVRDETDGCSEEPAEAEDADGAPKVESIPQHQLPVEFVDPCSHKSCDKGLKEANSSHDGSKSNAVGESSLEGPNCCGGVSEDVAGRQIDVYLLVPRVARVEGTHLRVAPEGGY